MTISHFELGACRKDELGNETTAAIAAVTSEAAVASTGPSEATTTTKRFHIAGTGSISLCLALSKVLLLGTTWVWIAREAAFAVQRKIFQASAGGPRGRFVTTVLLVEDQRL